MKNLLFSAACGILLFILLEMTACTNVQRESMVSKKEVKYAVDPLDAKIADVENKDENIFSLKGLEKIEETDEGFTRRCPVKFINSKTGAVIDTVFVFEENY